jgi:hypothetical protein
MNGGQQRHLRLAPEDARLDVRRRKRSDQESDIDGRIGHRFLLHRARPVHEIDADRRKLLAERLDDTGGNLPLIAKSM